MQVNNSWAAQTRLTAQAHSGARMHHFSRVGVSMEWAAAGTPRTPPVSSTAAEHRAFYLHYARRTATFDLSASIMALLVHMAAVWMSSLQVGHHIQGLQRDCFWIRTAAVISTLLLLRMLGKERYILSTGAHSVWQRMLFAAGLMYSTRPAADCRYCSFLWRHRLLFVHLVSVARRISASWYWFGGAMSIITVAVVDAAGATSSCCCSVVQLAALLQVSMTSNPRQFIQQVLRGSNSTIFLVDVVAPGLVLTWLEHKGRKQWFAQQSDQQQHRSAAITVAAAATTITGTQDAPCVSMLHRTRMIPSSSIICNPAHDYEDDTDYSAYAASDLSIGAQALCFGFPDPTAEEAYLIFKSDQLQAQDFLSCAVLTTLAAACTAVSGSAWHSGNHDKTVQALIEGIVAMLAAMAHSLAWAASWQSKLAGLQPWRGALLCGGYVLGQLFAVACTVSGGSLGAASKAWVTHCLSLPLPLIAYRHILRPALICANIAPASVLLLQFQFLVVDDMYGGPQVFGLGPNVTASLLIAMHLAVALRLEWNMRRRFVDQQYQRLLGA